MRPLFEHWIRVTGPIVWLLAGILHVVDFRVIFPDGVPLGFWAAFPASLAVRVLLAGGLGEVAVRRLRRGAADAAPQGVVDGIARSHALATVVAAEVVIMVMAISGR